MSAKRRIDAFLTLAEEEIHAARMLSAQKKIGVRATFFTDRMALGGFAAQPAVIPIRVGADFTGLGFPNLTRDPQPKPPRHRPGTAPVRHSGRASPGPAVVPPGRSGSDSGTPWRSG